MNTEKCLIPDCPNMAAPALKRGLCMKCYSSARKMVERGAVTWDKLVKEGLALDSADSEPFLKAVRGMGGKDDASH